MWSNPKAGKSCPQGMGVNFLDLPPERAEQLRAFEAQVRRERGIENVTDLSGRAEAEREEPTVQKREVIL